MNCIDKVIFLDDIIVMKNMICVYFRVVCNMRKFKYTSLVCMYVYISRDHAGLKPGGVNHIWVKWFTFLPESPDHASSKNLD